MGGLDRIIIKEYKSYFNLKVLCLTLTKDYNKVKRVIIKLLFSSSIKLSKIMQHMSKHSRKEEMLNAVIKAEKSLV